MHILATCYTEANFNEIWLKRACWIKMFGQPLLPAAQSVKKNKLQKLVVLFPTALMSWDFNTIHHVCVCLLVWIMHAVLIQVCFAWGPGGKFDQFVSFPSGPLQKALLVYLGNCERNCRDTEAPLPHMRLCLIRFMFFFSSHHLLMMRVQREIAREVSKIT